MTAEKPATDRLATWQAEMAHLSRVNAMSMMATTIAHELNQPLAAIRNYAAGGLRLLDTPGDHAAMLADAFQAIDDAAERAGAIISGVRTLMRRGETTRSVFDLRIAATECIRLVLAGAETDASIDNRVASGLMAMADRVQIQQVMINLLRNAIEAAANGSRAAIVTIDAAQDGARLTTSIADNGPGLSNRSDELFEWGDSAKEGGMGLGLPISRTIIEAHGGSIWLALTGASGSEFRFTIPAAPVAERAVSNG